MPRSRSRKKRGNRRTRPAGPPDSVVLLDLLAEFQPDTLGRRQTGRLEDFDDPSQPDDLDELPGAALFLLDAFDRAAWSFYAGPGPEYAGREAMERGLAQLRAREWFLFEFELPSGVTAAEEWLLQREGEPGSGGQRRAISRFVNGECGVFEVRDVRDGWLVLSPLDGGDRVRARTIDRGLEMIPGVNPSLPTFTVGDTIAGRLYWQDDRTALLSAGACLVTPEARAHLLADPPPPRELRAGLALESALGADASSILPRVMHPCFPNLVDSLLSAVSDGTFDYPRLWRELEGEPDPVAVTRQLVAELNAWSDIEPQLLAWAVAATWLRRREAAAGRKVTPDAFERERRSLEEHVRTVLDVPGEPDWPPRVAARPLAIADDETFASIERLEVDEVEWIVDVLPDPLRWHDPPAFAPAPVATACLIVEQPFIPGDGLDEEDDEKDEESGESEDVHGADEDENPYDGEEVDSDGDEDEEYNGDEDDEAAVGEDDEAALGEDDEAAVGEDDEAALDDDVGADGPLVLQHVRMSEGADTAAVAGDALVETLLAEGRETRPERIVFRQRALAARLAEMLEDAGIDVELRYFDETVAVATLDIPPPPALPPDAEVGPGPGTGVRPPPGTGVGPRRRLEAGPPRPSGLEGGPPRPGGLEGGPPRPGGRSDIDAATEAERLAYARLVDAAERGKDGLESLAANTAAFGDVALVLTLAQPLAFPFSTLEGVEERVGSMAVIAESELGNLHLRIHPAAPGEESRFGCRGPAGDLLIGIGDSLGIEIERADKNGLPPPMRAAGLVPSGASGRAIVVPLRHRDDGPEELLRGRGLDVAAGLMEAVASAAERIAEEGAEDGSIEARVDPLGEVKVAWRGWLA